MCPFGFVNFTQQKIVVNITLNITFVSLDLEHLLLSRCFHFTLPIFSFQSTFSVASRLL